MKKKLIIPTLTILLISCDNILPLPSRSGKNVFGCKVDGKIIKTSPKGLFSKPLVAKMSNTGFTVLGVDYGDKISVDIVINNISEKGKYVIDGTINAGFVYEDSGKKATYKTTSQHTGEIHLTKFDTVKKIVSGTFEFEAINTKDSTDIIKVRKGRFDVDINRLN